MPTTYLVSFATPDFYVSQKELSISALKFGVDKVISYADSNLTSTRFYQKNHSILSQKPGGGYWLWKPYIILKTLQSTKPGDIVIYLDSGIKVISDLDPLIALTKTNDIILFRDPSGLVNGQYVKRDCFLKMDCDSKASHDSPHLQAAVQVYKNTPTSISFVKEWLRYCQDPLLLTDTPNQLGLPDLKSFITHRHDQSILSLLAYKHHLPLFRDISQYGAHLHYTNSPYPVLVNHHRQKIQTSFPARLKRIKSLFLRRAKLLFQGINALLPPNTRSLIYQSTKIFYARNMAIVRHIQDGVYEPELISALKTCLLASTNPIFVDIGANIGLVSIALYRQVPNLAIHAFEPGPSQYSLFRKTIKVNNLRRIFLKQLGIGDKSGSTTFSVHSPQESSADGFRDTKRVGKTSSIRVQTSTLDAWWIGLNRPSISAIKIDTEGSEYLVLKGAKKIISHCHPAIFFEMQSENLNAYDYQAKDILNIFSKHNYSVFTLSGIKLSRFNTADLVLHHTMYIAKSKAKTVQYTKNVASQTN